MSERTPKILAFAGSLRRESFNKRLVKAVSGLAEQRGAEVTLIDLADYPLPLYDADMEVADGLPEHALSLKELFLEADALLISTPEYNTSLPAVLKNVIDWVSRPREGEALLACFRGKALAAVSASPGAFGATSALGHLRQVLMNLGMIVVPGFTGLINAGDAFDHEGNLKKDATVRMYSGYMKQLVALAGRE